MQTLEERLYNKVQSMTAGEVDRFTLSLSDSDFDRFISIIYEQERLAGTDSDNLY